MSNYDFRKRDAAGAAGWVIIVVAFLLALSLAVGVVGVLTQGWFINRENLNVRNSIGYAQRANEQCIGDITKYNDPQASAGQKAAAVNDCRVALSGVPDNLIDTYVAQFMASK